MFLHFLENAEYFFGHRHHKWHYNSLKNGKRITIYTGCIKKTEQT